MTERGRRTGQRLRALKRSERRVVVGTLALFAVVPFVAAVATVSAGWQATGDVAVIGLRSRDAWTRHAPLLGLTTTGEELTGTPANHPGPIQFWILGLTTRVFGSQAGMVLGAALINAAALVGTAWLAFRRGGVVLLALISVTLAGLVHSLTSASLHDVFNPELTTFPMLLTLMATWCVVVGDLRVAPVLVAAASIAGQIHLAGAGFVAPLVLTALVAVGLAWRRHPGVVRRERAHLLGAGALALLLWSPAIIEELSSRPSNVAALWRVASVPRSEIGIAFMAERLALALAPVPTFLRGTGRFGFLEDTSGLGLYVAALILGATVTLAVLVRRRSGRRDVLQLAAIIVGSTMFSVWLGARQPPLAAFRADGTRWLWVVGLMSWVTAIWAGWHLLRPALQDRIRPMALPVCATISATVLSAALVVTGLGDQRDGAIMPATSEAASTTIRALPRGTYRLQFEGSQALITVGPAIAYRLEAAGRHVRVDDNSFGRAYGSHRTQAGPVDGSLLVSSGMLRKEPSETLIAEVGIDQGRTGTIRVYLKR